MKIESKLTIWLVSIILVSCTPATQVIPTETTPPTSTFMPNTSTPTIISTPTFTPSPTMQTHTCNPEQESIHATINMDIFAANQRLRRTVNLGEALEFPDKGHWDWINKEETFFVVKEAGFSAVRIPIDFAFHADSDPPFTIQPSFWKDVDSVVNKAIACQLTVIVNMHNFDTEVQLRSFDENRFVALWNEIAEHYKNYPDNVLYFEPYNEPIYPGVWNTLLAKAVTTIRKSNPTRPIIIAVAEDYLEMKAFSTLKLPADDNLIVTFHYYAPGEFTHQCVDFIEGAMEWCGTTWKNTPDQIDKINRYFDSVANWAESRGRPIFMGEFGSISNAALHSRVLWTTTVREAAESHGFSWGFWDLCDTYEIDRNWTFGILDCYEDPISSSADWTQVMLQALIPEP